MIKITTIIDRQMKNTCKQCYNTLQFAKSSHWGYDKIWKNWLAMHLKQICLCLFIFYPVSVSDNPALSTPDFHFLFFINLYAAHAAAAPATNYFTWYLILNILQTQLQKEHLPRGARARQVISWKWYTKRKRDKARTCKGHSQSWDKV